MNGEKYIIRCPRCGDVEGYVAACGEDEDDTGPGDADGDTEAVAFETEGHPITRIRCPRCGSWLNPEMARPA